MLPSVGGVLVELLILPDGLLEVLSQPDALLSVRLILDEHLIDLGHLDTALDLLDLDIALVKLAALLADRALVAIDELLSLGMLLLTAGHRSGVHTVEALLALSTGSRPVAAPHRHCMLRGHGLPSRVEHVVAAALRRCLTLGCVGRRLWEPHLLERCLVHVLEQFILLSQLVLENDELGVDLAILIPQVVDLHLGVHVLLVEILPRLQSHRWNFALELPRDLVWRAKNGGRVVLLGRLARLRS